MIACNDTFIAVPWNQTGTTAVFTHSGYGKVRTSPPVLTSQNGAIIDVQFDPFNNRHLFTASDDGSIFGWCIPPEGLRDTCNEPIVRLMGHTKKCGSISFNCSSSGILASAGADRMVNVWDSEKGISFVTVNSFADSPMCLSWNLDGALICAVSRDKLISVIDSRTGGISLSTQCHDIPRSLRCVWGKRCNRIITFGFDSNQQRQVKVWDARKMCTNSPLTTTVLDQGSAPMMPCFDEDLNILHIGSKGIGGIRSYELMVDNLVFSHEFVAMEPIKGMCMLPKDTLNVKSCEIARLYQLTRNTLFTVQMTLPRKSSERRFQDDLFPLTFSNQPALSAERFIDGARSAPFEVELKSLFDKKETTTTFNGDGTSSGTQVTATETTHHASHFQSPIHFVSLQPKNIDVVQKPTVHIDPTRSVGSESLKPSREAHEGGSATRCLIEKMKNQREELTSLKRLLDTKIEELLATSEELEAAFSRTFS